MIFRSISDSSSNQETHKKMVFGIATRIDFLNFISAQSNGYTNGADKAQGDSAATKAES